MLDVDCSEPTAFPAARVFERSLSIPRLSASYLGRCKGSTAIPFPGVIYTRTPTRIVSLPIFGLHLIPSVCRRSLVSFAPTRALTYTHNTTLYPTQPEMAHSTTGSEVFRFSPIQTSDHAGNLWIVAILTAAYSCMAAVVRNTIKRGSFGVDDFVFNLAMACV